MRVLVVRNTFSEILAALDSGDISKLTIEEEPSIPKPELSDLVSKLKSELTYSEPKENNTLHVKALPRERRKMLKSIQKAEHRIPKSKVRFYSGRRSGKR
jgi:hypothetical protein